MPLHAFAGRDAPLRAMRPIWLFAFNMVAAIVIEVCCEGTKQAQEVALTTREGGSAALN
jgi:hypothetical protein